MLVRPRVRRLTGATCLALVAAAVLVAGAAALEVVRVSRSVNQAPNSAANSSTGCGKAKNLIGGGHALVSPYDPVTGEGAQALVQHSFPADKKGYKVRSFAIAGGTDSRLFAIGLCQWGDLTRRSVSMPILPASHLAIRVKCPQNRHVVGGGYRVEPAYDPATGTGSNAAVHTSKRFNEQVWLVGATRDSGDDATLVATAICERDFFDTPRAASGSAFPTDVGRYEAVARCPRGTRAVAGGFKARPLGTPGSSMSTGLFPWISVNAPTPKRRGWAVGIHNALGPLPNARVTAYAYCKYFT